MTAHFPALANLSSESLAEIRRDRLEVVLAGARHAPFYATRLASATVARFEEIPFLTKDDLRGAYPFGLLAVPRQELATYHESTGTSGEPTSSYFTEKDWDDVSSRFSRNAAALKRDDAVLIKTPYAMVTTAHQMHRAARDAGALVVPADNRSGNMSYPRVVRLLRDVPINVSWSLPTEAFLWAAAAQRAGLDPQKDFPHLRALVVAGEPVSLEKRRRLGAIWGARVFEDYGSTETGSLAGECTHGALHLWADRFHYELLDEETGTLTVKGRGELVITSLYREAMPLIRYRLEDVVAVSTALCPCGWNLPTINVCGRASVALQVDDRRIFPVDLEAAVFSLPLERRIMFWRARCTARNIEVEIEATDDGSAVCHELEELIIGRTGVQAHVSRVRPGEIVPDALFASSTPFRKPRFVFGPDEDWTAAVAY